MKSSVKRLLTHTITNNLAQQINCVEAVPVRWLTNEEKKCFWPQFKTKNLTKLTLAVKAAIQPTKEFSKYPVRVYKKYRKQFIKIKCTRIYISKYRSTFLGENTQLILIEVRKWCFCKIFDLCLILFLLLDLVEYDTARKNLDKATYASDLQTEGKDEAYASQKRTKK